MEIHDMQWKDYVNECYINAHSWSIYVKLREIRSEPQKSEVYCHQKLKM